MKIFISTNYGQLYNVIRDNRNKIGINLLEANPILGYDEEKNVFSSSSQENFNLYLVQDSADADQVKTFVVDDLTSQFILLRHTAEPTILNLYNYLEIFTGMNATIGKHYPDVFKILLDDKNDKITRILEHFDVQGKALRNEKLNFLNKIYDGHTNVEIPAKLKGKFNDQLYEPLKDYSYNKDLDRPDKEAYQNSTEEEKNKHNEMREALQELRDAILKIN